MRKVNDLTRNQKTASRSLFLMQVDEHQPNPPLIQLLQISKYLVSHYHADLETESRSCTVSHTSGGNISHAWLSSTLYPKVKAVIIGEEVDLM